jgi:UMF1 family MFS transporter
VQDRIGTRNAVQGLLVIWALTQLVAGFATREWVFWIAANFVGFSMGALGSASRVMVGLFSPQHKAGEFFGFYGMANKMAVILGMVFQFLLGMWGMKFNVAIGASAVFFVIGFFLMFTVNERAGRIVAVKAAREHVRKHRDYAGKIEGDVT